MRGTKAKEFRKLAAEIHELQPPEDRRQPNNHRQAMTSHQRHTYQWLKGPTRHELKEAPMTRNIRMLSHEIPLMQIARKARFEAMACTARTEEQQSVGMLRRVLILGLVITACLLAWWLTSAPVAVQMVEGMQ